MVTTAFPPLIGYGTAITLCGFAYGTFDGWLVASLGFLLSSLVSFMCVPCCLAAVPKRVLKRDSAAC